MPSAPQSAREQLLRHYGSSPIPAEDQDLLHRFERAKTDRTFTDVERARLKRDLAAHPILGGAVRPGVPDLALAQ